MDMTEFIRSQLGLMKSTHKSELRVCMVCLGNICRSPMAAAVLSNRAHEITSIKVLVDSAGTGAWHIGEGPNFSSEATWRKAGYEYGHTAQQFAVDFFSSRDLILAMDSSNYRNILKLAKSPADTRKVFYLRQFDPLLRQIDPAGPEAKELEVPDPYGLADRAFEKVLEMVEDAVDGLIDFLNS